MNNNPPPRNLSPRHQAKRLLKDKGEEFLAMEVTIPLKANWISILAMHGALCLALRHPQFKGQSRQLVVSITKQLGKYLVDSGILTQEQLAAAERHEAEAGSEDLL